MSRKSEWSEEKLRRSQQTNSRQFQPAPLFVLYHLNKLNGLNSLTVITPGFLIFRITVDKVIGSGDTQLVFITQ